MNGDVIPPRLFQERTKDPGGDIATTADGNDEIWLEGRKDSGGRSLAELVDLSMEKWLDPVSNGDTGIGR